MPVRTNITTENQRFPTNADVVIPCEVEGYPTPQVQWYKDGVSLNPSERVLISGISLAFNKVSRICYASGAAAFLCVQMTFIFLQYRTQNYHYLSLYLLVE